MPTLLGRSDLAHNLNSYLSDYPEAIVRDDPKLPLTCSEAATVEVNGKTFSVAYRMDEGGRELFIVYLPSGQKTFKDPGRAVYAITKNL